MEKYSEQIKDMIFAGLLAKSEIMKVYSQKFDVEIKSDDSPVTAADLKADAIIREYLGKKYPEYAFLTEESKDNKERLNNDYVFIIDPVDGTADFVDRNDEFTTNIALAYKHEIVAGVVILPAQNYYYYAIKGQGAYKVQNEVITRIHVNEKTEELTVLCSRFHLTDAEKTLIKKHSDKITTVKTFGSSLKPCFIAEGLAEISYRLNDGTKEWDTAAFDIIVTEAGGYVLKPNGEKISYNRENVRNVEGYVVANKKENILL